MVMHPGLMIPRRRGASFSPADIAGGILWLDAQDFSTLFQDSGGTTPAIAAGPVGLWQNKFGGQDASQSTAGARPTYNTTPSGVSFPVISFDGSDDRMSLTGLSASSGGRSVIAVYVNRMTIPAADVKYLLDIETGRLICAITGNDNQSVGFFDGAWNNIAVETEDTPQIVSWVFDSTATIYRDGTSLGTASHSLKAVGGSIGLCAAYGGGQNPEIDLGELLVFNGAISDDDHNLIGEYLAAKWGIAWNTIP